MSLIIVIISKKFNKLPIINDFNNKNTYIISTLIRISSYRQSKLGSLISVEFGSLISLDGKGLFELTNLSAR